jgi:hypothetical protein
MQNNSEWGAKMKALRDQKKADREAAITAGTWVKPEKVILTVKHYRQAIKQNCLNCAGDSMEEVRHCRVTKCSLHPFRPYK